MCLAEQLDRAEVNIQATWANRTSVRVCARACGMCPAGGCLLRLRKGVADSERARREFKSRLRPHCVNASRVGLALFKLPFAHL